MNALIGTVKAIKAKALEIMQGTKSDSSVFQDAEEVVRLCDRLIEALGGE